jgi:hypothetical protein
MSDLKKKKKIYLKVIFCKDNFYVFFKFKKNLDNEDFESEVVFLKNDFHGKKIVFEKNDFESVHFSNKIQKSYLAKKYNKKKMHFLTSLAL